MGHNIFSTYHPVVVALYFTATIVFSLLTLQPLYVLLSCMVGAAYLVYLKGWRSLGSILAMGFFMVVVIAAINIFFGRQGATSLVFIFGQSVTLEAVLFSVCTAGMLVGVVQWFFCLSEVLTTSRFLHLFSHILPTIALVLSMIFRLIPALVVRYKRISDAQIALLGGKEETAKRDRAKQAVRLSSVLMAVSMEDSIVTADSMRARGYGTKKRSTFSEYVWERRDKRALSVILVCIVVVAGLMLTTPTEWSFFPTMPPLDTRWWGYLVYTMLLSMPLFVEGKAFLHERIS